MSKYRNNRNIPENKPIDNDVSFRYIPDDKKNIYASKFRDVARTDAPDSFGNDKANEYLTSKLDTFDGKPYFKYDNDLAKDFLDKYRYSFIISDEEKATPESIISFVMGNPNANMKNTIGYPGSEGVGVA